MSHLNTAMLDDRIPLEAADAIEPGDLPPHPYHALEALRYTTFTLGDAPLWIALLGAQRATWTWGDEVLTPETAAQKLRALATATTEADLEAAFGPRYKQAIWFVRQIPYTTAYAAAHIYEAGFDHRPALVQQSDPEREMGAASIGTAAFEAARFLPTRLSGQVDAQKTDSIGYYAVVAAKAIALSDLATEGGPFTEAELQTSLGWWCAGEAMTPSDMLADHYPVLERNEYGRIVTRGRVLA